MTSEQQHDLLVGLGFQNAPVMTGWLRRRRYESLIVSTFREACESIETGQYHVILIKSQLPDGGGFVEFTAGAQAR